MSKQGKVMIGIVIAMSITAIVLVAVGVATNDEPTLMGACWSGNDVDRYEVGGFSECPPVTLRGDDLPLSIAATTDNPHPPDDPVRVAAHVTKRINHRVGFELLRVDAGATGCAPRHSICLMVGVAYERGVQDTAGSASHHKHGGRVVCDARTSNTGTAEMLALVAEHEIGHCLGLAHDDYDQSIMRLEQRPTPDRQIPPWVSDRDVDALQEAYRR